jgi:mRNA-degrading endonuclease toxin of MazEF toxin-antitoxin module
VRRGELWLAQVGRRKRPVLVLTRSEVIDVRELVTVVNCDGIHTVAQGTLTEPVGEVSDDNMRRVCSALSYALGC